jgi:hypothetical protein
MDRQLVMERAGAANPLPIQVDKYEVVRDHLAEPDAGRLDPVAIAMRCLPNAHMAQVEVFLTIRSQDPAGFRRAPA